MRYLLLILLLVSCSPEKRLARLIRKHPELIKDSLITVRDTVVTKAVEKDTVFAYNEPDTVTIKQDKLQIKYKYIPQTKEVYIQGVCDTDTVYVEKVVKVPVIQNHPPVKDHWTDHWQSLVWFGLAVAFAVLSLVFRILR